MILHESSQRLFSLGAVFPFHQRRDSLHVCGSTNSIIIPDCLDTQTVETDVKPVENTNCKTGESKSHLTSICDLQGIQNRLGMTADKQEQPLFQLQEGVG